MTFTYGATSLQVNGIILPYSMQINRYQSLGIASNAAVKIRDEAVSELFIDMVIREGHRKLASIRSFFEDTVKLSKYAFYLLPDSGIDFLGGDGVQISVIYWSSDFIESMPNWHAYEYNLRVRKV